MSKSKEGVMISLIFLILTGIVSLIYFLDYYPLATIELKMDIKLSIVGGIEDDGDRDAIYYYTTNIYDENNQTFIGIANGCVGTYYESYLSSAGVSSDITNRYPYQHYSGNIPSWLCSHVSNESQLWKTLEDNSVDDDVINKEISLDFRCCGKCRR